MFGAFLDSTDSSTPAICHKTQHQDQVPEQPKRLSGRLSVPFCYTHLTFADSKTYKTVKKSHISASVVQEISTFAAKSTNKTEK